jgi:hypothetical protein
MEVDIDLSHASRFRRQRHAQAMVHDRELQRCAPEAYRVDREIAAVKLCFL